MLANRYIYTDLPPGQALASIENRMGHDAPHPWNFTHAIQVLDALKLRRVPVVLVRFCPEPT